MKCAAIVFAFALAAAGAADAGDWRRVATGAETIIGVDLHSISVVGDQRTVWQVMVFDETQPNGTDYTLYRTTYDCRKGNRQIQAYAQYRLDGTLIDSFTSEGPFDPVFPDSLGYGAMETVCGREKPESDVPFDTVNSFASIQRLALTN